MKTTILISALVVGVLNPVFISPASAITFYDLGTLPGGTHSSGYDVSDVGRVAVGSVQMSTGEQAFRWTPTEGMSGLGYKPGYIASTAYGISGDGSVVVGYDRSSAGQVQAFRWTQSGGMTGLGYLNGGNYSSAAAVSGNGSVIVGEAGTGSGFRAFRWTPAGGMQNLDTLIGDNNSTATGVSGDGSTVVGSSYFQSGTITPHWEAFRWTQSGGMVGLGYLPGDSRSQATAVSPDGSAIVGISGSSSGQSGFLWTLDQGMVDLGLHNALDVSGDGSVVVGSVRNGAAIWDAAHGTRELRDMLLSDGINLDNWSLASCRGVSADGTVITGVGQYGNQLRAWMVVIPEPASAILLVVGVAVACAFRSARRRA